MRLQVQVKMKSVFKPRDPFCYLRCPLQKVRRSRFSSLLLSIGKICITRLLLPVVSNSWVLLIHMGGKRGSMSTHCNFTCTLFRVCNAAVNIDFR